MGFYRVVANDVHLYGITNGITISGTVNIPIEYSVSSGDQVSGFAFSINGLPIAGAIPQTNGVSSSLQWDTTAMQNGTYILTPEIDFNTDDPVQGTTITITVSNLVSYPNYFTSVFGQWMWIYAESAIYPANYQLDMYDSNTNYIGSFTGPTSDGVISFIWDLTDGNGTTYSDDTFTGQFTITPTAPDIALFKSPQTGGVNPLANSTTLPPRRWGKETSYSGLGTFVVAFSAVDNNSTKTMKVGYMVLGGPDGTDNGVIGTLGFQGLGPYQLSPGNNYASSAFYMGDSTTRTQLLGYLGDLNSRNFYFFGHGSANSFGGGTGLIPTITSSPKTSEFEKSNGWHGVQWRFWDWILSDVTPCSPANDRICFRRLPLKAPVGFWWCF
jgi:hypothetical protein